MSWHFHILVLRTLGEPWKSSEPWLLHRLLWLLHRLLRLDYFVCFDRRYMETDRINKPAISSFKSHNLPSFHRETERRSFFNSKRPKCPFVALESERTNHRTASMNHRTAVAAHTCQHLVWKLQLDLPSCHAKMEKLNFVQKTNEKLYEQMTGCKCFWLFQSALKISRSCFCYK